MELFKNQIHKSLSKKLENLIYEKTGYLSNIAMDTLHIRHSSDKVQFNVSAKIELGKSDFEKIVDTMDVGPIIRTLVKRISL